MITFGPYNFTFPVVGDDVSTTMDIDIIETLPGAFENPVNSFPTSKLAAVTFARLLTNSGTASPVSVVSKTFKGSVITLTFDSPVSSDRTVVFQLQLSLLFDTD